MALCCVGVSVFRSDWRQWEWMFTSWKVCWREWRVYRRCWGFPFALLRGSVSLSVPKGGARGVNCGCWRREEAEGLFCCRAVKSAFRRSCSSMRLVMVEIAVALECWRSV